MKKKIKCWKLVADKLTLQDAIKFVQEREFNFVDYERLGFGRSKYDVLEREDLPNCQFTSIDILKKDWCIFEPDTHGEEILHKVRELVKNEHLLSCKFEKIDNMSLDDIFTMIYEEKLYTAEPIVKYRLIKKLIEEKLYK